jgi:PleD family two-component response regulator
MLLTGCRDRRGSPPANETHLPMIRILIADDHDVVRSGLRRLLEAQPGWEVVAEAADGKDAIAKATATKPDVVVLDSMMPFVNGADATRHPCPSAQDRSLDLHALRRCATHWGDIGGRSAGLRPEIRCR